MTQFPPPPPRMHSSPLLHNHTSQRPQRPQRPPPIQSNMRNQLSYHGYQQQNNYHPPHSQSHQQLHAQTPPTHSHHYQPFYRARYHTQPTHILESYSNQINDVTPPYGHNQENVTMIIHNDQKQTFHPNMAPITTFHPNSVGGGGGGQQQTFSNNLTYYAYDHNNGTMTRLSA
eukprot:282564_1